MNLNKSVSNFGPAVTVLEILIVLSWFRKKRIKFGKKQHFYNIDLFNHMLFFYVFKTNTYIWLNCNKKKKKKGLFKFVNDVVYRYRYYLYNIINKITTRENDIKNIVKIRFTKSNVFSSILVEKFETDVEAVLKYFLVFTISIGTFNKLTKFTGWKKKNTNFIIMLSNFIYNILFNSGYITHTLLVKNVKKSFFAMLPVLQKIKFKYLIIKDRSFFSKIKTKKKTNIKRRLSRKMTYVCPVKM